MKQAANQAKVSAVMKERHHTQFSKAMKDRHAAGKIPYSGMSQENRALLAERMRLNNPMRKPEVAARMGVTMRARYADPELKMQWLAQHTRHINKLEQAVLEFLAQHQLPFRFTGDKSFWIGPGLSGKHRNPDFIHETTALKQAILVHGRFWHQTDSVAEELADYYSLGWQCYLVFDNDKLDRQLAQRIARFVANGDPSRPLPLLGRPLSTT